MIKGIAAVALIVTLGGGALVWNQTRARPQSVSGILEADAIRLGSHVGGRVAEVLAQQGDEVDAGEVLVRLEPFNLVDQRREAEAQRDIAKAGLARMRAGFRTEERAQARARRDAAQAALDEATVGPRQQELEQTEELLREAKAELLAAEQQFTRTRELMQRELVPALDMDEATARLDVAKTRVNARQSGLAMMHDGTRKEQIAQAQARFAQAEAELSLTEAGYRSEDVDEASAHVRAWEARIAGIDRQLAELEIAAPSRGAIEAIDLHPGDIVTPNAPVITLSDRQRYWVRAYLPETLLHLASLNAPVELAVDGFPDRVFSGRVAFVAQQPEFTPNNVQTPETRGNQVYRIRVEVSGDTVRLRPGMAADLTFAGDNDD